MNRFFLYSTLFSCLLLAACWKDHFEASDRLDDQQLKALKSRETLVSQYNYLLKEKLFVAGDLKSEGYGKLNQKQRIELYLQFRRDLDEKDLYILKQGAHYKGVSRDWIRALYGHPKHIDVFGGLETWQYEGRDFVFSKGVLVDENKY